MLRRRPARSCQLGKLIVALIRSVKRQCVMPRKLSSACASTSAEPQSASKPLRSSPWSDLRMEYHVTVAHKSAVALIVCIWSVLHAAIDHAVVSGPNGSGHIAARSSSCLGSSVICSKRESCVEQVDLMTPHKSVAPLTASRAGPVLRGQDAPVSTQDDGNASRSG